MRLVCAGERAGGNHAPHTARPVTTPDMGEVAAVRAAARRLSEGAYSIVASIVGAPSVEELKNAICTIEPQELVNLRVSFTRMGI